jgi:hypothetical protein
MQRRRDQVDQRRRGLQLDSREIAIPGEIALLEMAANAKPIIGRLQREMNVLRGFQFKYGQTSGARNRKQVQDAVFASRIGEDLGVDKSRVELGVDAGYVLANE